MNNSKKEKIYLASMLYLINKSRGEKVKEIEAFDCSTMSIIKKAEKLSLGREPEGVCTKPKVSLLQSVNNISNSYVIKPQKLTLEKDCFPISNNNSKIYFKTVWEDFIEEFKYIESNSEVEFGESLLNLLLRFTSNLPADDSAPDISLYDHIKTTMSLATSLYDYYEDNPVDDTPFIIIGGDMSGIQKYIYEIVSKYAGKNLKGRSFYIRLLSDAIVRYICKELDLKQANIIYNSGGCFYILAPNTNFTKDKIKSCIETIELNLFNEHGTKLFIAIDYVEISEDTLLNINGQSLPDKWKELFEKRDKKKRTKYAHLIECEYLKFFEPIMTGGDSLFDVISGEEFKQGEMPYENIMLGDIKKEVGNIKTVTGKQILLGKLLRETDIILVAGKPLESLSEKEMFSPINLGTYYYFLKNDDLYHIPELNRDNNGITIITFNGNDKYNCDFTEKVKTSKCIKNLQFYGGNKYNQNTFEEMCENENFHRLGILRMDVDNLGSIFQSGIKKENATLSRYSELSRSLDYYFSGYLNTIQQSNKFIDKTYIIYSGGDDLFIVGDWKTIISMAEIIREDFRNYTCNNPTFSISGGITIVPDKYPIMRGAQECEEEEKKAKNHFSNGKEKNAISILGYALNWESEFPILKQLKTKIVSELEQNHIEKSFISKIISHYLSADISDHKIRNMKTFWMLAYDLGRMKNRITNDKTKAMIDNCIKECCSNRTTIDGISIYSEYHPLELWALAARWAELETRSNQ